ncbi:MAG: cytochrome P460 family protein [Magnetovibrio sp.]|nr:cytochrome P460 family protein [Magnetovibrio sp.]
MLNRLVACLCACACLMLVSLTPAKAQMFGTGEDVKYAEQLWLSLNKYRLVGPNSLLTTPYEGIEPHGFVLETIQDTIVVNGEHRVVIVKRNYGPEGVEVEAVADDPMKYLAAHTVMVKFDKGYDTENQDWYYVKYSPDGMVLKNPAGVSLAGRVGKNADAGCIPCHASADGDDYIYNHNRFSMGAMMKDDMKKGDMMK